MKKGFVERHLIFLFFTAIIITTTIKNAFSLLQDDETSLSELYGGGGGEQIGGGRIIQLSEAESGLYGKPVCTRIPSNMSLCSNINYTRMKMPNLLGHEQISEVVHQSAMWTPLVSIKCHEDAQMFLCSMFAPVCVEQAPSTLITPCRSLCESVRASCAGPMLAHNYPWPSMFECSKFPQNNGLCIQPSKDMPRVKLSEKSTAPTTTITSTTTKNEKQLATPSIKTSPFLHPTHIEEEVEVVDDEVCHACEDVELDMTKLVNNYCDSHLAFRGRIQSLKISRIELSRQGETKLNTLRAKKLRAHTHRFSWPHKSMSLYIKITRRDRKVLKGARRLATFTPRKRIRNGRRQRQRQQPSNIDLFLMSDYHLSAATMLPDRQIERRRKAFNNRRKNRNKGNSLNLRRRNRHTPNLRSNNSPLFFNRIDVRRRLIREYRKSHCTCDNLRAKLRQRRRNNKYFITANVMRTHNLVLNFKSKIRRGQQENRRRSRNRRFARPTRLVYMTSVVAWHKARPFVDYLEDTQVDKTHMCRNVTQTVGDIFRLESQLFRF